jgi:hypothetical protein
LEVVAALDHEQIMERLPPALLERFAKLEAADLEQGAEAVRRSLNPSPTQRKLRIGFWQELARSVVTGHPVNAAAVYGTVCTSKHFYLMCEQRAFLAFLLQPPEQVRVAMQTILDRGFERIYEILELPLVGDDGKVDGKALTAIMRAFQLAADRVLGPPVQRVETKSMNVNVSARAPEPDPHLAALPVDEKLVVLEERLRQLTQPLESPDANEPRREG